MKLDKIANSILKEAEEEREKIISNAKNEAKEIIENKKSELEGINLEKLTHFEQDIEKMVVENVASKRLAAKREVQIAKDQVIKKSLSIVKKKLYDVKKDDKKYFNLLKRFYEEGKKQFNGNDFEILVSKEDVKIIKKLNSNIKVSKEVQAGFIMKSKSKKMMIDYTFDTILKDKESEITEVLSKSIF